MADMEVAPSTANDEALAPSTTMDAADNTPASLIPPNQTLYARNLNEKVKKEELKKALYALFSQYGQIMDVVALKTVKMRGQAFVVFKDVASATAALRQLQGYPFFDKPMNLQYAKGKSFAVGKLDGSFNELKRKRDEQQEIERENKKKNPQPKKESKPKSDKPRQAFARTPHIDDSLLPPNKILFLQNLPDDLGESAQGVLTSLFRQFNGFKEIRLVPGRGDIAFVEFEDELTSTVAKDSLQNFMVTPTHSMRVTYARR